MVQENDSGQSQDQPEIGVSALGYCVMNAALTRASAAIGTDFHGSTPALMAEHVRPAPYYFYREPAAFSQSEVGLRMELEQRGERVLFNHKLEVLNVP